MSFLLFILVWGICTWINYGALNRAAHSRGVSLNKYRKFENLILGLGLGPVLTIWYLLFANAFLKLLHFVFKTLIMGDEYLEKKGLQEDVLDVLDSITGCGPNHFKPAKTQVERDFTCAVSDALKCIREWIESIDYNELSEEEIKRSLEIFDSYTAEFEKGIILYPRQKEILEQAIESVKFQRKLLESYL